MSQPNKSKSTVGGDILNLVTAGMYANPLAIYREYIQNTADAVSATSSPIKGQVHIRIDPEEMSLKIRDNGPGLSHQDALQELVPIACSQKERGRDRGFRGIGRLAGLAFAETVTFRTRAQGDQSITCITWSGPIFRDCILKRMNIEDVIQESVNVTTLPDEDHPDHFFEVEIGNVARYAAGSILNSDTVRAYVSEVCPVPMASSFPFIEDVDCLFEIEERPLNLQIFLDEEDMAVTRQHGSGIQLSEDREDPFTQFEEIRIPAIDGEDGNGDAAIGWLAHSSYYGAIPKGLGLRGLRAREGNIQIGDESIFDHLFPEERFNRWCVGELHIVDPRIIPNGRRDYFESGPHTRHFENHLSATIRGIISRCRRASITRNQIRKQLVALEQMEDAYALAVSGYLSARNARILIECTLEQLERTRKTINQEDWHAIKALEKLDDLNTKLKNFRPKRGRPPFGNVRGSDIAVYQQIFNTLIEISPSPRDAKGIIEAILAHA